MSRVHRLYRNLNRLWFASDSHHDDGPDYSPDRKWIYINSDRCGKEAIRQVWSRRDSAIYFERDVKVMPTECSWQQLLPAGMLRVVRAVGLPFLSYLCEEEKWNWDCQDGCAGGTRTARKCQSAIWQGDLAACRTPCRTMWALWGRLPARCH